MISKGNTHNNGVKLADYMVTAKEGERVEMGPMRGFEATNIKDAFRDVEIMADATKCEQPFFHVQVRNRPGEKLTKQQFELAADRIERILGLTDQPRAITFHTYEHNDDMHMHVAWSRIDQDTMKAKPLPYFKRRLKQISRELEWEFGLEPVTNHRKGPIHFAPTRAEEEQARRLGLDVHEVRNTIRHCWDRSDCGRSFQAALESEGYILAKGERRDFIIIDPEGGVNSLGKRIVDVTAAKIRNRLSDLSKEDLPTEEMAKAFAIEAKAQKAEYSEQQKAEPQPVWDREKADREWQEAVMNAAIEKEKLERNFVEPGTVKGQGREQRAGGSREKELGRTAGEIRLAWSLTKNGRQFAQALEDRGLILAEITAEEAERLSRWDRQIKKEQEAAEPQKGTKKSSQRGARQQEQRDRYRAGELVVINQYGSITQLTLANTGCNAKERAAHLMDVDRAPLLSVTAAQSVMAQVRVEGQRAPHEVRREARRVATNENHFPLQPEIKPERSQFKDAAIDATDDKRMAELKGPAAQLWAAWRQDSDEKARAAWIEGKTVSVNAPTPKDFAAALDDKGLSFAAVTKEEAAQSHREAQFAREVGRYKPRYQEGEIVLVTEPRPEYRRDGQIETARRLIKLDQGIAEKLVNHLGIRNELQGLIASLQASDARAQKRSADLETKRMNRAAGIEDLSLKLAKEKGLKEVRETARGVRQTAHGLNRTVSALGKTARAAGGLGKSITGLADGIASLFAPTLTPEQIHTAERSRVDREADAQDAVDLSKYTSEMAMKRDALESDRAAEHRKDRDRDGRDR